MNKTPLIEINDLTQDYVSRGGLFGRNQTAVRVLDQFNLTIYEGETLGIVGESGCGKSTLANTLLRLIPATGGAIQYGGDNILHLDADKLRDLRQHFQMVFQNPFTSLNPRMTVLDIVAEPLRTHRRLNSAELRARVSELVIECGLSNDHLVRYPHELSGGQAQRVAVARALALNPKFLILDEPTSALDVSVQAQIINLLVKLQQAHGLTYLFISHDLGVVQHIADRIAVMYLGELIELGSSESVFANPQHPYTQALLSATPTPSPNAKRDRIVLQGNVPSIAVPPAGCRFHTRCPHVFDRCREQAPSQMSHEHGWATCHLLGDE